MQAPGWGTLEVYVSIKQPGGAIRNLSAYLYHANGIGSYLSE